MTTPAQPIRLYRHPLSGHAHRAELLLHLLALPYQVVEVDLRRGAQKEASYLAKNSFGQVPVIEDGDLTLADSNAILLYLATRYDAARSWYPEELTSQARIQRWFSAAAGPLAAGPATARLAKVFGAPVDVARASAIAAQLFGVMEKELSFRPCLVLATPTLADLAMYTYTALAPEGDISLEPYPAIRAWLARLEQLPRFFPMQKAPPRAG